jgi:hypothetical protein
MMNITETVKQLLIINILFFVGAYFVPASYDFLALHYFESEKFKFWQPLTHMFMHGGLMHIAFNMFALYSFGSALEHRWGSKKFIFFYISCGLGSALLYSAFNYYQFHQVLNVLIENGFNKTEIMNVLSQGKFDTFWHSCWSIRSNLWIISCVCIYVSKC